MPTTPPIYPDGSDPGLTTMDEIVYCYDAVGAGVGWADLHTPNIPPTATAAFRFPSLYYACIAGNSDGGLELLSRSVFLFDTSMLGVGAVITNAVTSFFGSDKDNPMVSLSLAVVSSNPASNIVTSPGDFSTLGNTVLSNTISFAGFTIGAYNDFTLNALGLAAINPIGITKLGLRDNTYDIPNVNPLAAYGNSNPNYLSGYYAEEPTLARDPKLVITYKSGGVPLKVECKACGWLVSFNDM